MAQQVSRNVRRALRVCSAGGAVALLGVTGTLSVSAQEAKPPASQQGGTSTPQPQPQAPAAGPDSPLPPIVVSAPTPKPKAIKRTAETANSTARPRAHGIGGAEE